MSGDKAVYIYLKLPLATHRATTGCHEIFSQRIRMCVCISKVSGKYDNIPGVQGKKLAHNSFD